MDKSNTPPRERILDVAEQMFYANGIRAVGVDTLIEEADVAKATFYRSFASKDELIEEVLKRRDVRWREWFLSSLASAAPQPADRPLAIFDVLAKRFANKDYRGCAFINSMVELANRAHPAHKAAAAHKQALTAEVDRILREAGWSDCDLAPAFVLLIDGAIVTSLREGDSSAAVRAKTVARALLGTKLPRKTKPAKKKR